MASERWAAAHPDDELILNIGRTWRLGPRPGVYMTVWRVRARPVRGRGTAGSQRGWTQGEQGESRGVATIVDAGLYAVLGPGVGWARPPSRSHASTAASPSSPAPG